MVQIGSQKHRTMCFFIITFIFSLFWLNLPMDHHHFGYNTKLTPKKYCFIVAKKLQYQMGDLVWGRWVGDGGQPQ